MRSVAENDFRRNWNSDKIRFVFVIVVGDDPRRLRWVRCAVSPLAACVLIIAMDKLVSWNILMFFGAMETGLKLYDFPGLPSGIYELRQCTSVVVNSPYA